jgi:hypothetical protein
MREPGQLRNRALFADDQGLGGVGGSAPGHQHDDAVSGIHRARLAKVNRTNIAKSPRLLSSGSSRRYGSGLWPEPPHFGAHSRARYLLPIFLSSEGNACMLEAFPSYRPEFHLSEWSLVTVRLRRNAYHGARSANPASAGCSAALRPAVTGRCAR